MMDEDLDAFFAEDELGSRAVWKAGGTGTGVIVSGIFNAGHLGPSFGGLAAQDFEVTFSCASAKVPGAAQGDTVKVGSTTYRVAGVRAEETGAIVLLVLKAQ